MEILKSACLLTVFCLSSAEAAFGQSISVDGSTATSLDGGSTCSNSCTITGGARDGNGAGGNLFHSFSTFNVDDGATVTFTDPGITNIFSRVTGESSSKIDGTLKVDGNANLFLLNSNGIGFGSNAQLNIPGSFVASAAESLRFQNGTDFSTATADLPSLLTVNVPLGLQFGTSPQPIQINGNGSNNLAYNGRSATIDRTAPSAGLIANSDRTLAFLGGDIFLSGGSVTAESGHIEIGSLGSNSLIILSQSDSNWSFDYSKAPSFRDITLSQQAAVDVSGNDAGSVQLQGRNISLSEGSTILGKVLANGGGQISLNASNSLNLEGIELSATQPMLTSALLEIAPNAVGDGSSRLAITAPNINLTAGAQVGLGMAGSGVSGEVDVRAQTINVDNGSNSGPSGFYAAVLPLFTSPSSATGQGGNLTITTDQLNVTNGAQIRTSTFDAGNAGNLTINAKDVEVVGRNQVAVNAVSSISSSSEIPPIPGLIPTGSGSSGLLTFNTERLVVADGGQIAVATISNNSAGNLVINASNSVELRGSDETGRSGLFASGLSAAGLPPSTGTGGNIQIDTSQLSILEGATINVSNLPSGESGRTAPSEGEAGNINIVATDISLKDDALITADTAAGDRANITLQSDSLVLRRGSNITTNATASATGGNINIDTEALIAFENSDITANAADNFGGRIIVQAQTILGTAYREQLTSESDITASSALGPAFSGSVDLDTPEVDPTIGLITLPADVADTEQVVAACDSSDSNTFVATRRGGLPENASGLVTSDAVWNDFRLIEESADFSTAKNETARVAPANLEITNSSTTTTVVEAQTWSVDNKGQVILGTYSNNQTSPTTLLSCLTQ